MKLITMIAIALFAIIALWLGFYAYIVYQNDLEQHAVIEHAVSIAESRRSQAHEYFKENRSHFILLAGSLELQERKAALMPYLIISVADNTLWWPHDWQSIPWISAPLFESILILLHPDTPGARDNSIIFHGSSMDYTLFGTPLHAVLYDMQPHAWVIIHNGETYPREDRRVVTTEMIEDGFYITVTSELLRNESRLYLYLTILFTILTLAAVAVLIWGIKTYRFVSEPDTTTRTVIIMFVVVVLIMFGTYLFFNTMDIRFA